MHNCSSISIFQGLLFRSRKAKENKSNTRIVRDAGKEAGSAVRKTENVTH